MSVSTSGLRAPKYRITRITISGDKIVDQELILFYDKVLLEGEHPAYDCGIHDDLSFAVDSLATDYYLYTFQELRGTYWVEIDDPRTPDQLCETCAFYSCDIKHHSMLKKKEKSFDYYEGNWNSKPVLL